MQPYKTVLNTSNIVLDISVQLLLKQNGVLRIMKHFHLTGHLLECHGSFSVSLGLIHAAGKLGGCEVNTICHTIVPLGQVLGFFHGLFIHMGIYVCVIQDLIRATLAVVDSFRPHMLGGY